MNTALTDFIAELEDSGVSVSADLKIRYLGRERVQVVLAYVGHTGELSDELFHSLYQEGELYYRNKYHHGCTNQEG